MPRYGWMYQMMVLVLTGKHNQQCIHKHKHTYYKTSHFTLFLSSLILLSASLYLFVFGYDCPAASYQRVHQKLNQIFQNPFRDYCCWFCGFRPQFLARFDQIVRAIDGLNRTGWKKAEALLQRLI